MGEYYYLGDRRGLTRLHTGAPFFVDTTDIGISTWLITLGRWESFVESSLAEFAAGSKSFVDCGANMGYYTIVARHYGVRQIFSFEPNPRLFRFLQDNVAINGMNAMTELFDAACGDKPGEVLLAVEPRLSGGGTVVKAPLPDREIYRVRCGRLDEMISRRGIDLLKIDVEGNEPAVIEGARDIIDHSPDLTMFVELSPHEWASRGWNPIDLLEGLRARGFRLEFIEEEGQRVTLEPPRVFDVAASLSFVTCMVATRRPAP